MANAQIGTGKLGVVDKRRGANYNSTTAANSGGVSLGTPGNYSSINAMRTRLAAANGAYYTSARLDAMTMNDMIFALRSVDDSAGI